jgi:molybdopterin converting factor small subunit
MMRDLTAGQNRVRAQGATVAEVIDEVERAHPGFKERLVVRGRLAPGLMVTVDGQRALRILEEPVGGESEVRFLPLMAGG